MSLLQRFFCSFPFTLRKMEELTSLHDIETNLLSYFPHLESHRKKPVVENPFKSTLELRKLDVFKMCLLCVLVPLRMILLGITLLFAYIAGQIFLFGYTETQPESPLRGFRALGQYVIYVVCRVCLFACGYHRYVIRDLTMDDATTTDDRS